MITSYSKNIISIHNDKIKKNNYTKKEYINFKLYTNRANK